MTNPSKTPQNLNYRGRAGNVVALGGGHGLAASLRALRLLTSDVTAVVTVADDGGSSGRLRKELGVLPPGDLRMALWALCDQSGDPGNIWAEVLQHRFSSDGPLDGHAMGNLLIVSLWELLGDEVAGLDWIASLLGADGRVLPMASVPLEIEADVQLPTGQHTVVRGQSRVAVTSGSVERVRLIPPDPPARPEAVAAINDADYVVLGPGSWFTSVMPHLLIPEVSEALHSARIVLTLNLSPQSGETSGYTAVDHLRSLHFYAPRLPLDTVIADPTAIEDLDQLRQHTDSIGARLLLRQVSRGDGTPYHDPLRLAAAYRDVFDHFLGDVGERAR